MEQDDRFYNQNKVSEQRLLNELKRQAKEKRDDELLDVLLDKETYADENSGYCLAELMNRHLN